MFIIVKEIYKKIDEFNQANPDEEFEGKYNYMNKSHLILMNDKYLSY